MKHAAKVLIVDDHPAVREALAIRISQQCDLQVCGEAADETDALRLIAETDPDVAIVDISLKSGDGLDLIKRIKVKNDKIRMIVWSMHHENLYAERALRAGALGYIMKEEATDRIIEAVHHVLQGKTYLSDTMTEKLVQRTVGKRGERSTVESLSDRELQVLRLIGQGLKTKEVAAQMRLSVKTIETYRERLRMKLELNHGADLARFGAQWIIENP